MVDRQPIVEMAPPPSLDTVVERNRAASQTLLAIARDDQHLGAQIGFTMVLHTWGQNLLFHPHVHCVVTGGGLSPDGTRWIAGREKYLLPVKVLGKLFRGKFLAALDQVHRDGDLALAGSTANLAHPGAWHQFKDGLYRKPWVVFAKPPFGGPEHVFHYLGRYTHRIAIPNHRLVEIADGKVTFSWKDYADGGRRKRMTLDAGEFLRRFLLHVLPSGFVRIRHYGLCASSNVNTKLVIARRLLARSPAPASTPSTPPTSTATRATTPWWERFLSQTGIDVMACPSCTTGRMQRLRPLWPLEAAHVATRTPDTS